MPLQGIEKIEDNEGSNPSLSANIEKGPARAPFQLATAAIRQSMRLLGAGVPDRRAPVKLKTWQAHVSRIRGATNLGMPCLTNT